jgi:serine/threonine-protein kinase
MIFAKNVAWFRRHGCCSETRGMEGLDTTRYECGARLGGGAMGEVWLVRDRVSGSDVAMKKLHWPAAAGTSAHRFEREVALQSRIHHRSVPRVIDRGHDASGAPWFTMERVEGRTLAAILDEVRAHEARGVFAIERTWLLRVFVKLCRAVEHAHQRGVVHRDLKPENVIVDPRGEVHLVDFGLAELVGACPEPQRSIVVGTPGYIAPELARGDGTAAHASGDVFALGAILFELVQLEPLYPQRHPLARLTAVLLEGDPIGARTSAPAIESILRCAIARDPSARFASADALAVAVELALAPARAAVRPRATLGIAAAAALGLLALSPVAAKAATLAPTLSLRASCDDVHGVDAADATRSKHR